MVFDGTYTNQATAIQLGCKAKVSELQTWFPHPHIPSFKIHVIFDACHMIKLMRNLLGDYKVICHESNGRREEIKWAFIEALNLLQEDTGFTFANKIQRKHICWEQHKMNVKIAAQTLSSSVAAAIDFLRCDANVPEFQSSKTTAEFIRINRVFGHLNSRNPFGRGYKAPVTA